MASELSIEIAPACYEALRAIKDKKVLHEIARVIDALGVRPDQQGKELTQPFEGVRSISAVRGRYRLLFQVHRDRGVVAVLLVGRRRPGEEADVYALARKLLKTLRGGGGAA